MSEVQNPETNNKSEETSETEEYELSSGPPRMPWAAFLIVLVLLIGLITFALMSSGMPNDL